MFSSFFLSFSFRIRIEGGISGLWPDCCSLVYYSIPFLWVEKMSVESQASNWKSLLLFYTGYGSFWRGSEPLLVPGTFNCSNLLMSNLTILLLIWALLSERCLRWCLFPFFLTSNCIFFYFKTSSNLFQRTSFSCFYICLSPMSWWRIVDARSCRSLEAHLLPFYDEVIFILKLADGSISFLGANAVFVSRFAERSRS